MYAYANGSDNTPERCASTCKAEGYLYFGLQDGVECFCGNTLAHQQRKAESDCNSKCPGDKSINCGGPWRNSIYMLPSYGGKLNKAKISAK